MDTISEITTLDVREAINIFLAIATTVMAVLYIRFVIKECIDIHWTRWHRFWVPWCEFTINKRDLSAVNAAIAWSILSVGEAIRSTFVWEVLHFDRQQSNYASEVVPLMVALVLIVFGTLCAIRVFSPAWMGQWLWIGTLVLTTFLVLLNFTVDIHYLHFLGMR
jgi:hypothetical protein